MFIDNCNPSYVMSNMIGKHVYILGSGFANYKQNTIFIYVCRVSNNLVNSQSYGYTFFRISGLVAVGDSGGL
jgi:hypothetical protein